MSSPELSAEFLFKDGDQLLHDGIDLLIMECFFVIPENKADGVRFFPRRNAFALIHIEQVNHPQEFLFSFESQSPDFRKADFLIE